MSTWPFNIQSPRSTDDSVILTVVKKTSLLRLRNESHAILKIQVVSLRRPLLRHIWSMAQRLVITLRAPRNASSRVPKVPVQECYHHRIPVILTSIHPSKNTEPLHYSTILLYEISSQTQMGLSTAASTIVNATIDYRNERVH